MPITIIKFLSALPEHQPLRLKDKKDAQNQYQGPADEIGVFGEFTANNV